MTDTARSRPHWMAFYEESQEFAHRVTHSVEQDLATMARRDTGTGRQHDAELTQSYGHPWQQRDGHHDPAGGTVEPRALQVWQEAARRAPDIDDVAVSTRHVPMSAGHIWLN